MIRTAILATIVTIASLGIRAAEPAAGVPCPSDRLLPPPNSIKLETGSPKLTPATTIRIDPACGQVGRHFAARLRQGTGWALPENPEATIVLEIAADPQASPEAYTLQITPARITIRAASPAGIARGAETLLQLMPPMVYGTDRCEAIFLSALTIADAPRFAWRGAMLDVSRKFQDKATVLKLLDGLASCKLNVFHWHLTDDQGWRLPIEGYPKLTEKGPAYSRADIREVVERAAALGITILPEVDMPGHSSASCRAYPEISTKNDKGNPTGTMNPGAEASYAFIETVMKDIAAQFPDSPYVHIGADEVGMGNWAKDPQCQALMQKENLKNAHDLYVHFVNRAVAIAKKHGKRTIAWDEAFNPKNDPSLIIMCWRGMGPGIAAAKAGRTVIFAPNPPLYINHANTRSIKNPHAYSAHPAYLNQIYFVQPDTPAIPAANRGQILGGEICLWGEVVKDVPYMFTHVFPRAAAMAENLWVPRPQLDWDRFITRMAVQNKRFTALGIPYFWEPESLAVNLGRWKLGEVAAKKGILEFALEGQLKQAGEQEIFVTQTAGDGQVRIEAVELLKDGVVVDTDRHPHQLSVYQNVDCIYIVKNPDTTGKYSLRLHVTPLAGDCAALVQLTPALAPDQYSKQCAPGSGANRSKQTPVR